MSTAPDRLDPEEAAKAFGRFLKSLRSQHQAVVAKQFSARFEHLRLTQPILARFESGFTLPKPAMLRALAEYYGEAFDRVLSAYVSTIVLNEPCPDFLLTRGRRPAVGPSRTFFASNELEVWSLDEIANWEAELASTPNPVLWIVSPNFVDDRNDTIRQIIVSLIQAGGHVVYFTDGTQIGRGMRTELLVRLLAREIGDQGSRDGGSLGNVSFYGLTGDELRFFTSSLVLAPECVGQRTGTPCGFNIIAHDDPLLPTGGSPEFDMHKFAIPLVVGEAAKFVEAAELQIKLREAQPDAQRIWFRDVLWKKEPFSA